MGIGWVVEFEPVERSTCTRMSSVVESQLSEGRDAMGHEASVIDGVLMHDYGQYAQYAPMPVWVVSKLSADYPALGLYSRLATAAALEDPEKMRVTLTKEWVDSLFGGDAELTGSMAALLNIGAITRVAEYQSGKMRIQMEAYPPAIRQELDGYRRPNGKLVASFS